MRVLGVHSDDHPASPSLSQLPHIYLLMHVPARIYVGASCIMLRCTFEAHSKNLFGVKEINISSLVHQYNIKRHVHIARPAFISSDHVLQPPCQAASILHFIYI